MCPTTILASASLKSTPEMAGLHHMVLLAGVLFMAPVMADAPPADANRAANPRASSTIPFKKDEGITATSLARLAVVVLIAVALAFAAIYALKRFYFGQASSIGAGRIKVIEARRLGQRTTCASRRPTRLGTWSPVALPSSTPQPAPHHRYHFTR